VALEWEFIRDKSTTMQEKLVLAEIAQLSSMEKGCFASNWHFSKLLGVKKTAISRTISSLEKKGFITSKIAPGSRNNERVIAINNRKRQQLKQYSRMAKIPKRFSSVSFDNYEIADGRTMQRLAYAMAKKYADNWSDRLRAGGGLTLYGKCGTGKTHLVCAIANQILEGGGAMVAYRAVYDVVKSVKSTWGRDSQMTESEAINVFVRPDLLIIDEVGVQFGSEAERLILFEILNRRYENVKPTIIVSNLDEDELTECLGERVIDRLKEGGGARIGFDWGSYRK